MKKRLLALLCAVLLVLGISACGKGPQTDPSKSETSAPVSEQEEKKTLVTLPYTSADVLNPFQTKSRVNLDIALRKAQRCRALRSQSRCVPMCGFRAASF